MSGGFGGLPVGTNQTVVEVNDMRPAESKVLCEAFDPNALSALVEKNESLLRSETVTYDIIVTDTEGQHQFKLDESQLSPEMLDLIDGLMHD